MLRAQPTELHAGRGLTSEQDPAEKAMVPVQGVAVPSVLAELVLTLCSPLGHTQADGTHHVRVPVAQLPLAAYQAWHIVTHHPGGAACSSHVPEKDQHRDENTINSEGWCHVSQETKEFKAWFEYEFLILLGISESKKGHSRHGEWMLCALDAVCMGSGRSTPKIEQ